MKRARRGDGRQALVAALVGALVAISIAPLRARAAPFPADGANLGTAITNCLAADATGACDCSSSSVDCKEGNGIAIGSWNTSQVTRMDGMFYGAAAFNQSISAWNTAEVTTMAYMFAFATAFNQDISAWNTAAVTNMERMFHNAAAFNQDISAWNTAAVTTMFAMFGNAIAFNQDISAWNTAAVTTMQAMFYDAAAFNQDISAWNTAAVTTMNSMFYKATAFNQDISAWNTAAVTDAAWMFNGATAWNSKYERNDASTSTDGPPSAWSIRMCLADQRVVANACVSCPAGTTNAAGDLRLGTDTACDAAPLSNARTFTHAEIAGVVVGVVASIIVAVALCVRRRRLADDRLRARLGIPTHSAPVGFPPQEPQIIIVQR
jgi:surface protein